MNSPNLRILHTKLMQAARAAGILPEDPLYVIITAFIEMLDFMDDVSERSDRSVRESSQRVFDAVARAKTAADAEQQRFETALKAAQARTIADVSQAIAKSAEAALTRRVNILERTTTLCVVAGVIISCWISFNWGGRSIRAELEQKKDELNAFSRLNPADSHRWAGLMLLNDNIKPDFDRCAETGGFDKGGRKACNFSFWIQ